MIAGTSSGVGKTSITLGIMEGLRRKGYKVAPYKVGPDYIDTGYHRIATGYESINLDAFMIPDEHILKGIFYKHMEGKDIGIIEGVMGLYDGLGSDKDNCSSAKIAKLLDIPVILVLDAKAMSTSAAAYVLGFQTLDPEVKIVGVIVNRVASQRHFQLIRDSIYRYCHIDCIGYMSKNQEIVLPSRHLGLLPTEENTQTRQVIENLATLVEEGGCLDMVESLATPVKKSDEMNLVTFAEEKKMRIVVAKDRAFHFYYEDNLELLERLGAEIVYFSPLEDSVLPEGDLYYIGGGFPEMFAKQLEANGSIRQALKDAHQRNIPIYGECGGLMYLGEYLVSNEQKYQMCGILPGYSQMSTSLKRFGYTIGRLREDCLLGKKGEQWRGHEFHHSTFHTELVSIVEHRKEIEGKVISTWEGGYQIGNTFASYLHIHFYQNIEGVRNLLANLLQRKEKGWDI